MTTPTLLKPLFLRNVYKVVRGLVVFLPWLLCLCASDVALSVLFPFSFIAPTAVYHLSSKIAYGIWRGVQSIFTQYNRAKITVSGAKLPRGESAVVVSNHVAWTDFYLIQHLALEAGMLSRCRWFAKRQLKWVPFLGWGLWAMGMPLVARSWDKDQQELDKVFRGPAVYRWPMWLISYSEGTRYTPQKYTEAVQWCKANNIPVPRYTLYPRTKGFVATVRRLADSSSIRAVYDLTLAYAHQGRFLEAPDMWQTIFEPNLDKDWRFHIHVERFDISEFRNMADTKISKWLVDRWMVKSTRLSKLLEDLENGVEWSDDRYEEEKKKKKKI